MLKSEILIDIFSNTFGIISFPNYQNWKKQNLEQIEIRTGNLCVTSASVRTNIYLFPFLITLLIRFASVLIFRIT